MTGFEFGDLVLVPFPFTDQRTTKRRPAVVVSSKRYHTERPDLIILAVTSRVRDAPTQVISAAARSRIRKVTDGIGGGILSSPPLVEQRELGIHWWPRLVVREALKNVQVPVRNKEHETRPALEATDLCTNVEDLDPWTRGRSTRD